MLNRLPGQGCRFGDYPGAWKFVCGRVVVLGGPGQSLRVHTCRAILAGGSRRRAAAAARPEPQRRRAPPDAGPRAQRAPAALFPAAPPLPRRPPPNVPAAGPASRPIGQALVRAQILFVPQPFQASDGRQRRFGRGPERRRPLGWCGTG